MGLKSKSQFENKKQIKYSSILQKPQMYIAFENVQPKLQMKWNLHDLNYAKACKGDVLISTINIQFKRQLIYLENIDFCQYVFQIN